MLGRFLLQLQIKKSGSHEDECHLRSTQHIVDFQRNAIPL